jgi:nucleotide-binding universal stress UspA family protein
MYRRILMPTDGSKCSEAAIAKGLELVKAVRAEVTFLYALEYISPAFAAPGVMAAYDNLKAEAARALQRARRMAFEMGVNSTQVLLEGAHPVTAIHAAAKDHDLVIMGTHARRGFDRYLLGSVTESVLRQTAKPCLIIRHAEQHSA